MPITVVGSIAYDAVKTPFGERKRMLGGAAVHFALAASFFEEVLVVGPVGEDFGEAELEVMRRRGVDVSDMERVSGGKTFFWRGEYGWDLNSRETLDTQLGVFEGFQPKLSERSRASEVLFLANIVPDLQIEVRAATTRSALRGARLDEPVDRHRPGPAGEGDRERRLPDPQRRRAAPADGQAKPRVGGAGDPHLESTHHRAANGSLQTDPARAVRA